MNVPDLLKRVHPAWIRRVANRMAVGERLRENFQAELERFYDLMARAIETGDPAWIDPVLYDWSSVPSQTDLQLGENIISSMLDRMLAISYEVVHENLRAEEGMELMGGILRVFTHALDKTSRYEMEARIAYISKDQSTIQAKLERLDQSKSNFISVAAHELKTPLTLIEGYTAMMQDISRQETKQEVESLIEGINNGIKRLRTIVDDMIDVSLIDNNLLNLNYQPLWLHQVLAQVRNELMNSILNRKQSFDLRTFPGSELMLFGDPERIHQAFRNIVNNAIKYTPDQGKIIIDGRLLPGYVEVTVSDSGIGISPKDQELIFDKFGQLGNVLLHSSGKTKFKGGGPGLGLPIARGIIEAHGGTIWVESEGQDEKRCPGSTFHVLLPIKTEPPDTKIAKLFGVEPKQNK
jgi:signal transduction histidine kinase